MGFIKRSILVGTALVCAGVMVSVPASATELSAEQKKAVSQNCDSIKQTLSKLEYSDLRTRTYLGSTYEAIAGRFITPLNLRLVKNGLPSTDLFQIQNQFTAAQTEFRNHYVDYMREMEALVAVDCQAHPQEFYDHLETVRGRREELHKVTKELADLAEAQYTTVTALRGSL